MKLLTAVSRFTVMVQLVTLITSALAWHPQAPGGRLRPPLDTCVAAAAPRHRPVAAAGSGPDPRWLTQELKRSDGVVGLDVYSIVHTREDQLLVVNEWSSIDTFMDYVNGPHNMIELIEHLCIRLDEENVCKAYSGTVIHQEKSG